MFSYRILLLSLLSAVSLCNAKDVVVGSYNLRRDGFEPNEDHKWFLRAPLVKKMILDHQPTVIGFQEATESQIQDLSEGMPDYGHFGTSRGARWWGLMADEAVPLFYDKRRVECENFGTFFINPGSYWLYDVKTAGLCPRICTWGLFKFKNSDEQFYVFNIHLDHVFEPARIAGLKVVLKWMRDMIKNPSVPVFLMGDFNTELTPAISILLADFKDVRDQAVDVIGPRETHTSWGKGPLNKIDHILLKKECTLAITRYETVLDPADMYMSDHRAIFATLKS